MIEKASILNLLNAAALMYGGITDYKRREIPNIVPICLLATGLISWDNIPIRIASMLLMALILWIASKLSLPLLTSESMECWYRSRMPDRSSTRTAGL